MKNEIEAMITDITATTAEAEDYTGEDLSLIHISIRSREISASIILQSQSQLKAIYKDNADTIVGNCDTMLFLSLIHI